jgi:hypothetical protein
MGDDRTWLIPVDPKDYVSYLMMEAEPPCEIFCGFSKHKRSKMSCYMHQFLMTHFRRKPLEEPSNFDG